MSIFIENRGLPLCQNECNKFVNENPHILHNDNNNQIYIDQIAQIETFMMFLRFVQEL